jgi:CheY-like chemotaxis protein
MAGIEEQITVLVADDDPLVRNLLNAVLNDSRITLLEAANGKDALDLALAARPDVVLLDLMMPGLDGFAACRAMRAEPRLSRTRILMLTAKATEETREQALAAGADAFFTKPFSPLELIDAIVDRKPGVV